MARPSGIDSHPERSKIIAGIVAGKPLKAIAESVSPPVSVSSVFRYSKGTLAEAIRLRRSTTQGISATEDKTDNEPMGLVELDNEAKHIGQVLNAAADPATRELIAEANRNRDALGRAIQSAEADGDHKSVATVAKADLDRVDQLAKLSGIGSAGQQQVATGPTIMIVMPSVVGVEQPADLEVIDAEVIEPESE